MSVLYEDCRYIKDCLLYVAKGAFMRRKELVQFKNKHKGERCFIVATGPSLTIEDIESIKNEFTFAVNSCFRVFERTDWRPSYYVITDQKFIQDMGDELEKNNHEIECAFCGEEVQWNKEGIFRLNTSQRYQNLPSRGLLRKLINAFKDNFMSSDVSKGIISGHSVVFSVLQIAEYMGFSEIYLLGTDCNYSGKLQYSELTSHTHVNKPNAADLMIVDYLYAKRHFDKSQKTIVYNATRGGMLEVFQRVNLDDII